MDEVRGEGGLLLAFVDGEIVVESVDFDLVADGFDGVCSVHCSVGLDYREPVGGDPTNCASGFADDPCAFDQPLLDRVSSTEQIRQTL